MRTEMLLTPLAAVAAAAFIAQARAEPPAALDRDAVKEIVREYLIEYPEVIEEALRVLQERREVERRTRARTAIAENGDALLAHPLSPVSGNPNGDVTVVEFFDYRCPYCKRALEPVLELLASDQGVRVVWKEFPILGPVSRFAARAAMAADRQGRYHEFHVAVMGAGEELTEAGVIAIAAGIGLDVERLRRDMEDPAIGAYLDETARLAGTLGIRGTPAFVIGDALVPGAIDGARMREMVARARAGG